MRIRVWLSRPLTLRASSFASLTRVCNAIRSALELDSEWCLRGNQLYRICGAVSPNWLPKRILVSLNFQPIWPRIVIHGSVAHGPLTPESQTACRLPQIPYRHDE